MEEDEVTVIRRYYLKEKESTQVKWNEIFSTTAKNTFGGIAVGGIIGSVQRHTLSGALSLGFYSFIFTLPYTYNMQLAEADKKIGKSSKEGYAMLSGIQTGLILAFSNMEKQVHPMLDLKQGFLLKILGSVLLTNVYCLCNNTYLNWEEKKRILFEKEEEERLRLYKIDEAKYGKERSDKIIHNVIVKKNSWLPSWFPIRPMSDEEYKDKLEKDAKAEKVKLFYERRS